MIKLPMIKCGLVLALASGLLAMSQPASATFIDPFIPIPTQLLSFGPIQGDAFLPLTNAANTSTMTGAPAAVDGYGWVNSNISITLSSQRTTPGTASLGQAFLGVPGFSPNGLFTTDGTVGGCAQGSRGTAGEVANGGTVCVNSFFDVFFDVKLTNIDTTGAKFGNNLLPQILPQNDNHTPEPLLQSSECIADTSKPNLGCLPPTGSAYIGHFQVKVNLGIDINGAGGNDVMKFDFVQHQVGGVTNTFLQGASVIDTFNSTMPGSGSVGDVAGDPPFTFTLVGPTTASQVIVFAAVPEPASIALLSGGLGIMFAFRRRGARQDA